jgi:hypothetical protein
MEPVEIDWSTAKVAGAAEGYDLEVHFRAPSSRFWWEAFGGALEILSRETTGARWETIRGVGEPPEGLRVSGVDEESATPLRELLDRTVDLANQEAEQAEAGRKARKRALRGRVKESEDTASRLTEAFRAKA